MSFGVTGVIRTTASMAPASVDCSIVARNEEGRIRRRNPAAGIGATPEEIKAIVVMPGPGGLNEGQKLRVLLATGEAGQQRLQPIRVILGKSGIQAVVALSDAGKYVSVEVRPPAVSRAAGPRYVSCDACPEWPSVSAIPPARGEIPQRARRSSPDCRDQSRPRWSCGP